MTRGKTRARTKRARFLPGKIIEFLVKGRRAEDEHRSSFSTLGKTSAF